MRHGQSVPAKSTTQTNDSLDSTVAQCVFILRTLHYFRLVPLTYVEVLSTVMVLRLRGVHGPKENFDCQ